MKIKLRILTFLLFSSLLSSQIYAINVFDSKVASFGEFKLELIQVNKDFTISPNPASSTYKCVFAKRF